MAPSRGGVSKVTSISGRKGGRTGGRRGEMECGGFASPMGLGRPFAVSLGVGEAGGKGTGWGD